MTSAWSNVADEPGLAGRSRTRADGGVMFVNRQVTVLIGSPNPARMGHYYRFCTGASAVFSSLDHYIGDRLWRWLIKRHKRFRASSARAQVSGDSVPRAQSGTRTAPSSSYWPVCVSSAIRCMTRGSATLAHGLATSARSRFADTTSSTSGASSRVKRAESLAAMCDHSGRL